VARIQDRSVNVVALSHDGRTVATTGASSVIVFWDGDSGKELRRTPGGSFRSLAFSPDGTMLASGELTGDVRFWDVATGQALFTLKAQVGGVCRLAFADSRRLATAGWDTTVLVWDLAAVVRGVGASAEPSRRELENAWKELGGADLSGAFRAAMTLRLGLARALPVVRDQIRPIPTVSAKRLRQLVEGLDADDFQTRQRSSRELERLGSLAEPALREAERASSLEVKLRASTQRTTVAQHTRRTLRLLPLLSESGTPQARALVEELSRGAPWAEETRAARLALRQFRRSR
jgi:hypothetical protein